MSAEHYTHHDAGVRAIIAREVAKVEAERDEADRLYADLRTDWLAVVQQLADLRAAVAALADEHWDWKAGATLHARLRALLDNPAAALDAVRAQAKAEALREAASDIVVDCTNQAGACICGSRGWLRDRADRIAPTTEATS